MPRRRPTAALAALLVVALGGVTFAAATTAPFRVADGPAVGLVVPGEDAGWTRRCLGVRYEVVADDAAWEQCLGVPVGPRTCYAYGEPTGPDGRTLPRVAVPCP